MGDSTLRILSTLVSRWWSETIIDRFRLWVARISGVEVTQAIQYWDASQHLTDPNDRGADNSVRLVANKPAWVRVYVYGGLRQVETGVTGTLEVERRQFGFLWANIATISPQPPGSVSAQSNLVYPIGRGSTANTLNFVVPASLFEGNLRLTARLRSGTGKNYGSHALAVDATLRQTLRIRAILVSYNGPSTAATPPRGQPPPPTIQLAAPTLADLQATAALALTTMPVQSTGWFASAGTLAWTQPLDDPRSAAGACSNNWNALLTSLTNQRTAVGNRTDVVYHGLLPAGIPLSVPGCGFAGLGAGAAGDQVTLAHEIGHGYGFQHTPCGNAGATGSRVVKPW